MSGFQDTDVWKIMCDYLDNYVENRKKTLIGLTGELGIDFDTKYSQHDLWRSDIRLLELVFKRLPEVIIAAEEMKAKQALQEEETQIQAQLDAMSSLTE